MVYFPPMKKTKKRESETERVGSELDNSVLAKCVLHIVFRLSNEIKMSAWNIWEKETVGYRRVILVVNT